MQPKPDRYSDFCLNDSFTCYVLLSEPLEAVLSEILQALREDYPSLDWPDPLYPAPTERINSNGTTMVAWMEPQMTLLSHPGRCEVSIDFGKSPGYKGAKAAYDVHCSHFSISVDSTGTDLASRFEAARKMTCFAAVFARLPVCSAIYFPSSDGVVDPDKWVAAADMAMRDEFPLFQWLSFPTNPVSLPGRSTPVFTVSTIGAAAFTGTEIMSPMAAAPPQELWQLVIGAAHLMLQSGNQFKDGDTFGHDDKNIAARVRFVPEGPKVQTDCWAVLHPDCILDEQQVFGPRKGRPHPSGKLQVREHTPGFLSKLLKRGATTH